MGISDIPHLISNVLSWITSNIFKIIGVAILIWFAFIGIRVYKKYNAKKIEKKRLEDVEAFRLKMEQRRKNHPKLAAFSDGARKTIGIVAEELQKDLTVLQEKAREIEDRQNKEKGGFEV